MRAVVVLCQVVAALGLLNVWLLRPGRPSTFRGAAASSMRAEFAAYGLPAWFMLAVGALKVAAALALLAGIWYAPLVRPAALLICLLMIGALAMHARVGDPLRRSAPAAGMLALGIVIALAAG